MGQLNALLKLDMSENILSGQVPPKLAALRDLEFLDLSKNNLSGGVPAAVAAIDETRHEVVDFTRSRVKNNTELTNLGN